MSERCASNRRFVGVRTTPAKHAPEKSKFVERRLTSTDIWLLLLSYEKQVGGYPIEFGIVEFYDKRGKLLDASEPIPGSYQSIKLHGAMNIIHARNHHRLSHVGKIVIKHTHPLDFEHDDGPTASTFSSSDITLDYTARRVLDSSSLWTHIELESQIIYFDPRYFQRGLLIDPIRLLRNIALVKRQKLVKVMAHRPHRGVPESELENVQERHLVGTLQAIEKEVGNARIPRPQ